MPSLRPLDLLVNELILNYHLRESIVPSTIRDESHFLPMRTNFWEDANGFIVADGQRLTPSQDIHDAFLVVERLKDRNWRLSQTDKGWQARCYTQPGLHGLQCTVESDSLPRAICECALKAAGFDLERAEPNEQPTASAAL